MALLRRFSVPGLSTEPLIASPEGYTRQGALDQKVKTVPIFVTCVLANRRP